MKRLRAVHPKAQAGTLGAGVGAELASILTGIIQTDVTHAPLSAPWAQLIRIAVPAAVALAAAWLAPRLPSEDGGR